MVNDYLFEDAAERVTAEMIKQIEPGQEIELNDMFTLFAYSEAECVVIVSTEDWEEFCVCLYDGDNVVIEMLY